MAAGPRGLCRVRITAGAPKQPRRTASTLTKRLCKAVSDSPARPPSPLDGHRYPEAYYTASDYRVKVTKITPHRDITMVRRQALEPRQIHVEAGLMFFHCPPYEGCPEGVERPFSIASDTRDKRNLEFIIRRNPVGICTKWIFEKMQVGDEIVLNGPHGDFRLHDTPREALFIAGGSGLSAIRSILLEMKNKKSPKKARLFFGAATCRDLYLLDELRDLEKNLPDFRLFPAVNAVSPGDDWDGETGLITAVLAKHIGDCSEAEAYLCGSPAMVNACIDVLTAHGMPGAQIYFDKFA